MKKYTISNPKQREQGDTLYNTLIDTGTRYAYHFVRHFLNNIRVVHPAAVIRKWGANVNSWFVFPVRKVIIQSIV